MERRERRDLSPKGAAVRRVLDTARNLDEPLPLAEVVRLVALAYDAGRLAGERATLDALPKFCWCGMPLGPDDAARLGRNEPPHHDICGPRRI